MIVEWSNGDKYPIYRKYSAFFDFEVGFRWLRLNGFGMRMPAQAARCAQGMSHKHIANAVCSISR